MQRVGPDDNRVAHARAEFYSHSHSHGTDSWRNLTGSTPWEESVLRKSAL